MVNIESINGLDFLIIHAVSICEVWKNTIIMVFEYNALISTSKMVFLPTSRRLLPLLYKLIEQKKGEQECRGNGSGLTTANLL